jgi:uncharacterized protein YqfB (UPF0267 family)
MKTHNLKIWAEFYKHVISGLKTFEIRKSDRDFSCGDIVVLRQFCMSNGYTGSEVKVKINYILRDINGIEDGYCIFGFKMCECVNATGKDLRL